MTRSSWTAFVGLLIFTMGTSIITPLLPLYQERFDLSNGDLTLLFAGEPRDGAVGIRADADIYFGKLDAGKQITHRSAPGRAQWLHVIEGDVSVAGETLKSGDGAAVENSEALELQSRTGAQFLLFDLK